jgi:hypothetical protein
MIIWSRWGLLTPIFGGLGLLTTVGLDDLFGHDEFPLWIVIGGIVAAISCWEAGSFLQGRLWFIPMKYYGPIYLVVFGAVAFDQPRKQVESAPGIVQQTATSVGSEAKADDPATRAGGTGGVRSDPASSTVETVKTNTVTVTPGPAMLSWKIRDVTDKITDETTRKAESGGAFEDGVSLEASAFCDGIGVEFAFDAFRGREAAPFAWKDDKIGLRLRIDGGDIRAATADAEYTNEAKIIFYEPDAAQSMVQGVLPHAEGNAGKLTDAFNAFIGGSALMTLQGVAAGKLAELAAARSIRVELPLADGSDNVVDLNPRDEALASVIRACYAPFEAQRKAQAEKAAADAARAKAKFAADMRADQDRAAKATEENRRAALAYKRNTCVPGQQVVVPRNTLIGTLDAYDPTRAGNTQHIQMPAGAKVTILDENTLHLPSSTKIPERMCVVAYDGGGARFIGALLPGELWP